MSIRANPFLAALQERKRITLNWSAKGAGPELEWPVQFRTMTATPGTDMQPIGSARHNLWKRAKLPWRSLVQKESISKFETLINAGGETTIVRIAEKLYPAQVKTIMDTIARDLYNDGYSASSDYNKRIHGFQSWLGNTGITAAQAGNNNGLVADPSDLYGGLYTNLGYYGGSWTPSASSEYPTGTGTYEYHFWSPLIFSTATTKYSPTTHDWAHQWKNVFNSAITYFYAQRGEKWDAFFLNPDSLRAIKDSLDGNAQIFVRRGPDESTLTKLGFAPISYEGVDIETDHNIVQSNVRGYGVCFDHLEIMSLQDQLIKKEGDRDITTQSDVVCADAYLNMKIESPAFSCEFLDGVTDST